MSLLLSLLGSAHGVKEAIDIEFKNGDFVRVGKKGILAYATSTPIPTPTPTPTQMGIGEEVNHTQIESILIDIDYTKPFDHLVEELITKPEVMSATIVTPSPDERCENKISQFNEIFHPGLPLQEKINLHRKFCSSLEKYKGQGSVLAETNLPIAQCNLGVVLANSAQESSDEISRLREAVKLIGRSSSAGFSQANENLPIVQNMLGQTLARSAQGQSNEILLLREALELTTISANTGFLKAIENLPIVQNNLGVALVKLSQGSLEGVSLMRKALELITINAADFLSAYQDLPIVQYNLGVALVSSSQGSLEEQIKAWKLITSSANLGLPEANKNLPAIRAALEKSRWRGQKRRRTN